MAEAALFNIAQLLLNKLGSVALDEIASTYGFKTNLKKLENSVNTIKDLLLDAQEKQDESHAVRGWLGRLRSVVYDADDLFDEFATMASLASQSDAMAGNSFSKEVRTFFSSSNRISFAFNISKRIKKIREELDDIVKDSSEFGFKLRPREEGSLCKQYRESHSFVHGEEVIGRDEDRKAVIDMLTASCISQEQRLSVVPIVGIGGLGKTTLAQLVYNDELVEKHFELKLWVCVSENFDVKEVIKKILMSATNSSESENLTIDQLQGKLRREIEGKKYLLVLDDVWNEQPEEWLNLSALLKVGGEGSKILTTTRSMEVADIMGTVPTYVLEGLSEEKSWALFEKMAFGPGESQNKPHLVKIGKEIMKKCAAVPLALRALGSLLRGSDERKWVSVADNSFAELPHNQRIMAILKLSYDNLLSPLKCCFAYCALFPKDYELEKETLLDLWMAEGFVVPAVERQSLDDVGDEYLTNLLQRCFFQDIKRDKWGNISSFKMHDLIHDLAFQVSETESKMAMFQDGNFSDGVRHLSFGYRLSNSWEIPVSILKAKQLRTFLLPEQISDGTDFNCAVLRQLISNFRCLRVLDLHNLKIRSLPKTISKLIHLRYLNLSMNLLYELPHSITRLLNLQTLILCNCRWLTALPIHTRNLTNLRSLDLRGCIRLTHMPPGLGELTSLQKLSYFVVPEKRSSKFMRNSIASGLKDLKTLNNLRGELEISFCDDFIDSASGTKEVNLSSKQGLTELVIICPIIMSRDGIHNVEAMLEGLKPHQNLKKLVVRYYNGEMLPSWVMRESLCTTVPNLVEIHLTCLYSCRQVPSFSQLPFLRCLILDGLSEVGYMEKSRNGLMSSALSSTETFFPSLQELELINMHNLKGWWEETKATDSTDQGETSLSFSELAKLRINFCNKLASFPLSPNVEELSLKDVNKHLNVLKKLTSSTVNDNVGSSVTKSEYRSKLKTLSIDEVQDLISLPEECLGRITSLEIQNSMISDFSTLGEAFKRLTSLSCLKFNDCTNLTSIPEGLEHLTKLDKLVIWDCCELDFSQNEREDGMPWKALTSLRSLHITNMRKLEHLPSGLQHLTNLRSLRLLYNYELIALPEWISCFSSLEYMELNRCYKLSCLPEEFGKLTTLSALDIKGCEGLTKRCRGPNGSDWPKIRHIPLLVVEDYDFGFQ